MSSPCGPPAVRHNEEIGNMESFTPMLPKYEEIERKKNRQTEEPLAKNYEDAPNTYKNFEESPGNPPVFIISTDDAEEGGRVLTLEEYLTVMIGKISVAQSSKPIRLAFLRKVYGLLSLQILITTAIAAAFIFTPGLKNYRAEMLTTLIISIAASLVFLMTLYFVRKNWPANFITLIAFTISEAIVIGVIVMFYPKMIILEAFILTFLVMGALTIYSCQSQYDISAGWSWLFSSIFIIIAGGCMQFYLMSSALELVLGIGGALLFCIYIIWDTQVIMNSLSAEEYILAVITLYLDILNLFLFILRILSIFARN